MIESSTWNAVFAEGKAEGKAEGRLLAERELCAEMVRRYHPALADAARAVIARTTSASLLKDWILKGPALDDAAFRRLLSARPRRRVSRRRSG